MIDQLEEATEPPQPKPPRGAVKARNRADAFRQPAWGWQPRVGEKVFVRRQRGTWRRIYSLARVRTVWPTLTGNTLCLVAQEYRPSLTAQLDIEDLRPMWRWPKPKPHKFASGGVSL